MNTRDIPQSWNDYRRRMWDLIEEIFNMQEDVREAQRQREAKEQKDDTMPDVPIHRRTEARLHQER
jgi:hypothetical protein